MPFSDGAIAAYKSASEGAPPTGSADVLVLVDNESYAFDAEGRVVHKQYLVYKILTQKGADEWAQVSTSWEPWHEERPSIRARVLSADGALHPLDLKTVVDAPAGENDSTVFSDKRIVRAPLPAIAPGSLVEEEELSTEHAPFFGAGSVERVYFGRFVPVQRTRMVLDAPASMSLRYATKLLPEIKPRRSENNGRVQIVFEAGSRDAFEPADDFLPSDVPAYPYVTFSTAGSWQQVAGEYSRIVDEKIASGDVKELVGKLIANRKTRKEKAAALLEYLHREVRYTGVEFGEAAVVPRTPAETLKQKYGDCKDKATLLVAMLRAAAIPAHVALLNVGNREDVSPDLPGMGMFDHAIVYAPGAPDLWIDPTDEYAGLGQLPGGDQGRLALIATPESRNLLPTPIATSQENLLLERRRFSLAENGPAKVVEISEPHGELESQYRREYADKENKQRRESLTNYVKSQYLGEKLDRVDRSEPKDISRQFQLELEVAKAKRGFTSLDSAVAAIRLETLFSQLPAELQQREDENKDKGGEKEGAKPKKKRTADYQLPRAFATEWHYDITPPEGFRPKPLPQNKKVSLGPAVLTEEFSAGTSGLVQAVIRFDSVKRRLSLAEATEMRNRVAELKDSEPIFVYFEPAAQTLFREGKLRESFEAYRRLISLHPKEAVHHLQIAQALLTVGLGEAAREEARTAVALDPSSALAQETLADVLKHDLVGRQFRHGSDIVGAEAAFRAAKKLDPDDKAVVGNLAILLEHNSEGERYGPGAKLKAAVEEYRSLKGDDLASIGLKNNLPFALVYAEDFAGAKAAAEALNPQPTAVLVASEAALHGVQAGISEAQKRTGNEADLREQLKTAGEILMRLRRYSLAADLLQAGASGQNASAIVSLASMLRKARPHEDLRYGNDPTGLAMQVFMLMADTNLTIEKFNRLASRNARLIIDRSEPEENEKILKAGRKLRSSLSRTGLPADVLLDIVIQIVETKQEGDDVNGYRVTIRSPGAPNAVMYIVKEDGSYKMLDSSEKPNSIGLEILDRLKTGNLTGARVLLDWIREEQHLAGGDDVAAGAEFPRFWTKGKEADREQIKLAAAALLAQTQQTAKDGIAILEPALPSVQSDTEKFNIALALIDAYGFTEEYEKLLPLASESAKQHPESKRLFFNQILALRAMHRIAQADQLAEDRLRRLPDDIDALRALVGNAVAAEDYALARVRGRKLVNGGKAEAADMNDYAWNALFGDSVTQDDIEAAIKAMRLQQNNSAILHTLGCVYAEAGKTKEAREVLVQGMDIENLDEPDSSYWYAFGRIAEQYGERDIAIASYGRVKKPKKNLQIPSSTYRLAQKRLSILGAATDGEKLKVPKAKS